VDVRGPGNEVVRHSTNKRPDGTSEIAFRPGEVGIYLTSIDFNGKPVSGSPFSVEVVDPLSVLFNDEGFRPDGHWILALNRRNVLDIDATAAGPGENFFMYFRVVLHFWANLNAFHRHYKKIFHFTLLCIRT
jgi:hypothetical protein